jgi:hypothetical protein
LFIHNQTQDLINFPRYFYEQITMKLFQVHHPQMSLLMGGGGGQFYTTAFK